MFCILFTMCTYPSQSVKISIHSCTFSKNFPIRRLMPIQYIPNFLMLIYLVIYFVINSPSAQYICKNTKNIQKCDYRDEFGLQGELDLRWKCKKLRRWFIFSVTFYLKHSYNLSVVFTLCRKIYLQNADQSISINWKCLLKVKSNPFVSSTSYSFLFISIFFTDCPA